MEKKDWKPDHVITVRVGVCVCAYVAPCVHGVSSVYGKTILR